MTDIANPVIPTSPANTMPANAAIPPAPSFVEDDDVIIVPQGPATSMSGEIPKAAYCALLRDATDGKNSNGERMLTMDFEIISPDVVPSQQTPGAQCSVAGRKFSIYATIQPNAKGFSSGRATLAKLNLLGVDGNIRPKQIVDAAKQKNRFYLAVVACEESFHRLPKLPGEKEGKIMEINGIPLSKGFRPAMLNAEDIITQCPAPEGYVASPF